MILMRPIIQQLMQLLLIIQIIKTMLHLSTAFQKLMDYKLIQIDNAEDLDVVMPMYNLFEYSKNYRKAAAKLLLMILFKENKHLMQLHKKYSKMVHHLKNCLQKLMVLFLRKQSLSILQCLCTI